MAKPCPRGDPEETEVAPSGDAASGVAGGLEAPAPPEQAIPAVAPSLCPSVALPAEDALVQERLRRRHNTAEDVRWPGQKDRDRILYTAAFRRLAGVTQVAGPREGHIVHNRLTHSLEVAQVARRLAEGLIRQQANLAIQHGGIDADVVEAAALAHDLGHPPFGHVAEKELDRLVVEAGVREGYEGNAQSFRIITQLAFHGEGGLAGPPGLDLTRATLRATLKYPWRRAEMGQHSRKWGYYSSEAADFEYAREGTDGSEIPCLEAQVMTWADDIAYSVHDTEDFYRAGLIPLDRLLLNVEERARFLEAVLPGLASREILGRRYTREQLTAAFKTYCGLLFLRQPYDGTMRIRQSLRAYTSSQIGRYITSIALTEQPDEGGWLITAPDQVRMEIGLTQQLTWFYVIDSDALATQQYGQREVIRTLFTTYRQAIRDRDLRVLPPAYQGQIREEARDGGPCAEGNIVRSVADMIAEMTDEQALRIYQRVTGHLPGSVRDLVSR